MFKITVKPSVNKDIKNINKDDLKRIFNNIQSLELNPLPLGVKKIKKGPEFYYRIRQGDFRIGYRFYSTEKLIEIIYIRRRSERTY
ncbi:MAG: type II toxin-antitoxin system RelE/ParE family toxin [Elusimicrobiota bacterium]|nr:type II toxin-antitoxin system RelE/ParE family toxin [Elusimicrobiota bacterium]